VLVAKIGGALDCAAIGDGSGGRNRKNGGKRR